MCNGCYLSFIYSLCCRLLQFLLSSWIKEHMSWSLCLSGRLTPGHVVIVFLSLSFSLSPHSPVCLGGAYCGLLSSAHAPGLIIHLLLLIDPVFLPLLKAVAQSFSSLDCWAIWVCVSGIFLVLLLVFAYYFSCLLYIVSLDLSLNLPGYLFAWSVTEREWLERTKNVDCFPLFLHWGPGPFATHLT